MLRACNLSSFMLFLTTYLVYVSAASIGNIGIDETEISSLARQRRPTKSITKLPLPNPMTLIATASHNAEKEQLEFYHPAVATKPRLIERYDKRALDGHYEYRYVLSNGDIRYERADWLPVGNKKVLARKGYYSYPLPNHRFHTLFYTADHMGYREDESSISRTQPFLPRRLEVLSGRAISINSDNSETMQQKQKQKQTNKINRNPNWTPTTKSILQKGRIAASAAQETGTAATRTRKTRNGRASAAESSATNRPQINKGKVLEQTANAINVPNGMTTRTTTTSTTIAMEQPSVEKSSTIKPIKAKSVQTTVATIETETEQPPTVDTIATVLSMD